jgi:threonine aldolase
MAGFASDNNAGVHPEIMQALIEANQGHAIAYGDDPWTRLALDKFAEHFGPDLEVYFVFLGTGANVLALQAATRSFHSVICAETAHIQVDECGAPEKFTGCKLLPVPAPDGKLTVPAIEKHLHGFGFEHHAQPRVVSITQPTELGTVYTGEEIRAIADCVHARGMVLHMDGARLANAAVYLKQDLRAITRDVEVDLLSFGGTKNGMMFGEAIVFFNRELADGFRYIRKQAMQLASKMRFISAQFSALLSNDLWRRNALQANQMAHLLAREVRRIPPIQIAQKVETNGIFAVLPPGCIPILQKAYFFYVWNEARSEVRWMTAFDSTEEDVAGFVEALKKTLAAES